MANLTTYGDAGTNLDAGRTFATAIEVETGTTFSGHFGYGYDTADFYRFTAESTGEIRIGLYHEMSQFNIFLRDQDNTYPISDSGGSRSTDFVAIGFVEQGKTYTLGIETAFLNITDYSVTISEINAEQANLDEAGDTQDAARTIEIGSSFSGQVGGSNGTSMVNQDVVDYYVFRPTVAGYLYFDQLHEQIDVAYLFQSDATQFHPRERDLNPDQKLGFEVEVGEEYYLRLTASPNDLYTDYSFQTNLLTVDPAPDAGNSLASATRHVIGDEASGQVGFSNDLKDVYEVKFPADGAIVFDFDTAISTLYVRLVDGDGNLLANANIQAGESGQLTYSGLQKQLLYYQSDGTPVFDQTNTSYHLEVTSAGVSDYVFTSSFRPSGAFDTDVDVYNLPQNASFSDTVGLGTSFVDVGVFTAPSDGELDVVLADFDPDAALAFEIYDDDLVLIRESFQSQTGLHNAFVKLDAGESVYVVTFPGAEGLFSDYTLQSAFIADDQNEPGETFADAATLGLGASVEDSIGYGSDYRDVYALVPDQDGFLTITLSDTQADLPFKVYDQIGVELAASSLQPDINLSVNADETYYIAIGFEATDESYEGSPFASRSTYQLSTDFTPSSADVAGNNFASAKSVAPVFAITGEDVGRDGDIADFFTFVAPANGLMSFDLGGGIENQFGTTAYARLNFYNQVGEAINPAWFETSDPDSNIPEPRILRVTEGETYYLALTNQSDQYDSLPYSLNTDFRADPADQGGNTLGGSVPLNFGMVVNDLIGTVGDPLDTFNFVAPANGVVRVNVDYAISRPDVEVGKLLENGPSFPGLNSEIFAQRRAMLEVEAGETYEIMVEPYGSDVADYSLQADFFAVEGDLTGRPYNEFNLEIDQNSTTRNWLGTFSNFSDGYEIVVEGDGILSLSLKDVEYDVSLTGNIDDQPANYSGYFDGNFQAPDNGSNEKSVSMQVYDGQSVRVSISGEVGEFTEYTLYSSFEPESVHADTSFDFNGDCTSDVLWRNTQSGTVSIWAMDGSSRSYKQLGPADQSWEIAGTGDFNGDLTTDILWRHIETGRLAQWAMDGGYRSFKQIDKSSLAWDVAGTGDFNGDGLDDILWQNKSNASVGLWSMTSTGYKWQPVSAASQTWKIKEIGDFNGDGTDDVLWRNDVSGDVGVWLMNDGNRAWQMLGKSATSWQIAEVGDFSGDGTDDILWRHESDGRVGLWEMEDARHSWRQISDSALSWDIAGSGDYTGDGKEDLLWRHESDGRVGYWEITETGRDWTGVADSGLIWDIV